jgi:CHAD domain-containing protein
LTRSRRLWLVSLAVGAAGAAGTAAAALRRRHRGARASAAPAASDPAPAPAPAENPIPKRARHGRAYRLGRGEPAGEGLRRVAIGRLDHALDRLDAPPDDPEAVHEARKDLKKLRSVLRLLRRRIGDEEYRRENAYARDTGRMLAGARDAQVRLETLDELISSGVLHAEPLAEFRARLEHDQRAQAAARHRGREPAERLAAARDRARAWRVGGEGWDAVGPGIKRSYRRGRDRMAVAVERPTVENLHEWRKRVKDLWYQLRLIAPAWPRVIDALAEEAHALSERLGDDHDLAVLAGSARDNHDAFADPAELDALLETIARRRAELQGDAVAIGRRLYADEPAAFVSRTRTWWHAWRSIDGVEGGP